MSQDLEIPRNINKKLVDQVTRLERKCWENEKYFRRECIEISEIPQSIEQIDLERTVLNVFDKTDALVDPQNIEACYRLKSDDNGRSNKVTVKFSKRKGMVRVMNKKKSLKNANLDGTGLPLSTSLFISPSICSYYKYLLFKCKALWSGKLTTNKLFADDTSNFSIVNDIDVSEHELNSDLRKISMWVYQ